MAIIEHSPEAAEIVAEAIKDYKAIAYLDSLRAHHPDSFRHSRRVGILCVDIGQEYGIAPRDLPLLGLSGVLHDIGKVRVPLSILDGKKSQLEREELAIVQQHPHYGLEILRDFAGGLPGKVAVGHHEFVLEGASYPRKKRIMTGEIEDEFAEITAVADFLDALAHKRSYKPPMSVGQSEEILRRKFAGNPRLIDIGLSYMKDV
ncbi:MAG: HD-GYP domain-containing protein [Candidatus Pacearchaeota archaeon]